MPDPGPEQKRNPVSAGNEDTIGKRANCAKITVFAAMEFAENAPPG